MLALFRSFRRVALVTAVSVFLTSACGGDPAPVKAANDGQGDTPAPTVSAAASAAPALPPPPSTSAAQLDSAPPPPPGGADTAAPAVATQLPAGPTADGAYMFRRKAPAVGAKVLEKEVKLMNMALQISIVKGKTEKTSINENSTTERTVEVMAVSNDVVTKIKVTYKSYEKAKKKDGKPEPSKVNLTGKTYILEAKDGAVTVSTQGGAAAPEEEAKAVKKDFKNFGKGDSMSKALPDKPIRVGDRVDSIAQAFSDRFSEDDSGKEKATVEKAVVTFSAVKDTPGGKVGVFDYSFDLAIDNGLMIIRMPIKGQAELRMEDAMPTAVNMKSPINVSSQGGSITGSGDANMSLTRQPK
ncbi:MAG: hypothetical protein IPK82_16070 [Polyangiaceae bacterium]|nr:hypothetical protein [Polyangiaceae bacterium]